MLLSIFSPSPLTRESVLELHIRTWWLPKNPSPVVQDIDHVVWGYMCQSTKQFISQSVKNTTQQAPLDQHHGMNRTLLQTDNRQCFVNLVYIIQKNKTPALLVKTAIDPAYFCLWETFVNNAHFILEISVMFHAGHGFLNLWLSKVISFSPSRFYRYIIPYAFINSDWLICFLIIVLKLIYPTVIQMLLLCKESGYD